MVESKRWIHDVAPRCLLIVATVTVFAFSCRLPFLAGWDDNVHVTGNVAHLTFSWENGLHWLTHGCLRHYMPATMFSYMIDYNLWGLNAIGYHCQNLFWHVLAVLGVYQCFLFFRMNRLVAVFAALAFAVHPQRAESVVWISERKDVLCAAFYFWSLYFYLRSVERRRFPAASLILFVFAILSKSMTVTAPLVLSCYEFHRSRSLKSAAPRRLWPFYLAAAFFMPIAYVTQVARPGSFDLARQVFVTLRNVEWYVVTTFIPMDLNPMYPRLRLTTATIVDVTTFCVVATIAAAMVARRRPEFFKFNLAPFLCAFLFSLAPVVGVIAWSTIDYADRYSYLPSTFLWLGVGILTTRCRWLWKEKRRRLGSLVVAMAYVVYLGARAFLQAETWSSYRNVLTMARLRSEANYAASLSLANLELSEGRLEKASEIADDILKRPPGWLPREELANVRIKAKIIKSIALDGLGRKSEARAIYREIKSTLDGECFTAETEMRAYQRRMR